MSDWVKCPICGESGMRCESNQHEPDLKLITCTNHNCGSNGGDNFDAFPEPLRGLTEGTKRVCDHCKRIDGSHVADCPFYKRQKMEGVVVSVDQVAERLGFASTEAFQEWRLHRDKSKEEQIDWLIAEVCNLRVIQEQHSNQLASMHKSSEAVINHTPQKPSDYEDAIHMFFNLSYAEYLTLPRSVLQSMPAIWQRAFVRLLEELDETIDWRPQEGHQYQVRLMTLKDRFDKQSKRYMVDWDREIPDPLADYQRGRRRIPHKVKT